MNHTELVRLQNIVLDDFYPQADALYVHKTVQDTCTAFDTCTYINLFSFTIWKENTTAANFYLHLQYGGAGTVTVHLTDHALNIRQSLSVELQADAAERLLHIPDSSFAYAYIAWEERADFKLSSAAWLAECTAQPQEVRLAVCIPTYKRRDDISSTLALYERVVATQNDFAAATHLYVHNNDPDDDLSGLSTCPQVTIINSEANIGGAGAFNRCAHLAVEKGYSHVLFMDDDALPHEEAWLRTLTLLQYLKPEKQEHFIAGNCLTREDPLFCHAVREAIDERGCIKSHRIGDFNLTDNKQLQKALTACTRHIVDLGTHPYAGWWYCVIPCSAFKKFAWPSKKFFCWGDDIEFSVRCKASIICQNGINIWHPSFNKPFNMTRRYYGIRNWYLLRYKHFGKKYILISFLNTVVMILKKRGIKNFYITCKAFVAFLLIKKHYKQYKNKYFSSS